MPASCRIFLFLLAFLSLFCVVDLSCPVQGCQTNRNFAVRIVEKGSPIIGWKTTSYRPSTIGCVSISDQVACTTSDKNDRLVVFDKNGVKQWASAASFTSTPSLPVYNDGMLIYSDGQNFTNHFTNGSLRYFFHPRGSLSFGTTIVNDIVAMSTRGGAVVLTTEDGRASEWISFDSGDGFIYVTYSAPVVGTRNTIYVLGHYFPYASPPERWPGHRLIALDNTVYSGTEGFIPVKRVVYEVGFEGYDYFNPWAEPAILYVDGFIYFRYYNFHGNPKQDYLFAVKDDIHRKNSGTQLWNVSYPAGANIQSLAFSNHTNGGLVVVFELNEDTTIQLLSPASGSVLKTISLAKFYGSWSPVSVSATTPIMVNAVSGENGTVSVLLAVHAYASAHSPTSENSILLMSFQENSTGTGQLLWKILSPDSLPVLGQMAPTGDENETSHSIVCATNATIFSVVL